MVLLPIIVFACYFIILGLFILGWNRGMREDVQPEIAESKLLVSVIIPARNECRNIEALLSDLANQRHAAFEVIVVDDHSEDDTFRVVHDFANRNSRIRIISNKGQGKKVALTLGVESAKGSIIVTTDADCRVSPEWLSVLAHSFEDKNVKMAFGGVRMEATSAFSSLQSLEFARLIGSGMAIASLWHPVMCNGANLAFRKSAFEEVAGYEDNLHIPSGDDEFLMRKILVLYPTGVKAVFHRGAVVSTLPNGTLREFLQQRIRWAGKWAYNSSLLSKALAVFIFCLQLSALLLPLFVAVGWMDIKTFLILVLSKASVEFLFLKRVTRFLSLPCNWVSFAILQVIYPLYVVFIGFISNFKSFEWKGRKLRPVTVSNKWNKEILG
jgi:poly-beta-1,6-N-acetyl-D-glucosamine synthase